MSRLTPNPPDYLVGKRVIDLQHAIYAPAGMDLELRLLLWGDEQELADREQRNFQDASVKSIPSYLYVQLLTDFLTSV